MNEFATIDRPHDHVAAINAFDLGDINRRLALDLADVRNCELHREVAAMYDTCLRRTARRRWCGQWRTMRLEQFI